MLDRYWQAKDSCKHWHQRRLWSDCIMVDDSVKEGHFSSKSETTPAISTASHDNSFENFIPSSAYSLGRRTNIPSSVNEASV